MSSSNDDLGGQDSYPIPAQTSPELKQHAIGMVGDLIDLVNSVVYHPISEIKDLVTYFFRSSGQTSTVADANSYQGYYEDASTVNSENAGQLAKSWWFRVLIFPFVLVFAILLFGVKIVLSPIEMVAALLPAQESKVSKASLLFSALCSVGLFVAIYFGVQYQRELNRIQSLRLSAIDDFENGDYKNCVETYRELSEANQPLDGEERFRIVQALTRTGRMDAAREALFLLAPERGERPGYPPAHRLRAISLLASAKGSKPSSELLRQIKWHLDCGGDTSEPDFNFCWAQYYLVINDKISALKHLEIACETRPQLNIVIAKIYQSLGKKSASLKSLNKAKKFFESQLVKDSGDVGSRITLSEILFELKKLDASEQVILSGPKDSKRLRAARAKHYLNRYSLLTSGATDFSELIEEGLRGKSPIELRFQLIKAALLQDLDYLETYHHLIRFYRTTPEKGSMDKVIETLKQTIKKESDSGLAYFALSNILWSNGQEDESRNYMEKAFELAPEEVVVVANNLAWILTESKPPELERAYSLAKRAVELKPDDGRIRDTLGTVLLAQRKLDEALIEFKLALPTVSDRSKVHLKIAQIYKQNGELDLAEQHLQKANSTGSLR